MKSTVRAASGTLYVNDVNIMKDPPCECGNAAEYIVTFQTGVNGDQNGELIVCGGCKEYMERHDKVT